MAFLLALATVVAWGPVALADDGATDIVQVVDTADEMGPGPFGEPLSAQAETIDQIVFGTNSQVRLTTWLPFLKGAGLDFVQLVCPVSHETLADGTEVYTIGLNRVSTALYADILTGKQTLYKTAVANFKKTGTRSNRGSFTPYYEVYGLYKVKGNQRSGDGAILLGVYGNREGQYYIFTGAVSFTGLIGSQFAFRYAPPDLGGSLGVVGSLGVKIAGGIGGAYLGRLGIYGDARLSVMGTVRPKEEAGWDYLKLRGGVGIEVVALTSTLWHKELWSAGPFDLITPRKSELWAQSEGEPLGPPAAIADDGLQIEPIAYDPASEGAWNGDSYVGVEEPASGGGEGEGEGEGDGDGDGDLRTSELSISQRPMRLLEESSYPDAQVEVVSTPRGLVMCWIASDATDASAPNRTRLMWSCSSDPKGEGTWSEPAQVDLTGVRNDTADFEPDLFADEEGNVHVVWLDAKDPVSSAETFGSMACDLCVSHACLKAGTDAFGAVETVAEPSGEAGVVRTSPKVAARAGEAICSYSTLQMDHLLDLGGTHQVFVATRDAAGTWSETCRYEGTDAITSLDAGLLGAAPAVSWTR